MNFVVLTFGILLIGTGFVTLIHKLHDRSMQESLVVLRSAHGDTGRAVAGFNRERTRDSRRRGGVAVGGSKDPPSFNSLSLCDPAHL